MNEYLDAYNTKVDSAMNKVKNNIDYFESFGNAFLATKVRENLEAAVDEIERVKKVVNEIES